MFSRNILSDVKIIHSDHEISFCNLKHKNVRKISYIYVFLRPQQSSALFFQYNTQLGPPYHILVDTNFVNFSIKNKLDIIQNMMECLYAKCTPYITDCVMGELEKLGQKYKLALKIIKDPRFERLPCMHKGTYADDCLVNRVTQVSINIIFVTQFNIYLISCI